MQISYPHILCVYLPPNIFFSCFCFISCCSVWNYLSNDAKFHDFGTHLVKFWLSEVLILPPRELHRRDQQNNTLTTHWPHTNLALVRLGLSLAPGLSVIIRKSSHLCANFTPLTLSFQSILVLDDHSHIWLDFHDIFAWKSSHFGHRLLRELVGHIRVGQFWTHHRILAQDSILWS